MNRCLLVLAVAVGVLGPASAASSQEARPPTPGTHLAQNNPYTQQQQWQYQQQQQQAAQQQRSLQRSRKRVSSCRCSGC